MALDLLDLYKSLEGEGIVFCFCGSASQSIVEGIGATLWQRMELQGTQMSIIGQVFPVFVEQMQNIVSHSAEIIAAEDQGGEELRSGIVAVGYADGHFYVRCGNFIENHKTEPLKKRLENYATWIAIGSRSSTRRSGEKSKPRGRRKGWGSV